MSVQEQITRLNQDKTKIRDKLVDLGLAQSTDNLDVLANAVRDIVKRGAVSAEVQEGQTYTIPAGYHDGSGTVRGVQGGGSYTLQTKEATPTTSQQSITPDLGFYGLSSVTVKAIPENYKSISNVTATATDVLTGKVFANATGDVVGTMANNGHVTASIDTETTSYTIPQGYHDGLGTVSLTTESKSATPTEATQTITPTSGKVLSSVTVNKIPDQYIDTSGATVSAANVLDGVIAYGYNNLTHKAIEIEGTMTNNGAVSASLNTTTTSYTIPEGYHNGSGSVSITLETKSATPSETSQTITPTAGKVLSSVTVNRIPTQYKDASNTNVVAANILAGKIAVNTTGEIVGTMTNNGAVSASLDTETTSYTIPTGYHNGSGSVSITLETKTTTPTESSQTITPTEGSVLSSVTVNAIPSKYKDATGTDAVAANILSGKKAVNTTGQITGSMPNNGAVSETLDVETTSYTIPLGYHSGAGTVSITTETKSATPSSSAQTITPSTGKVLSSVSIGAIPANWGDTSLIGDDSPTAAQIIIGKKAFIKNADDEAEMIEGTMADNGALGSHVLDTTTTSYSIPAGYTSGGSASIVLETKTATPTTSSQNITPTNGKVLSKVTVNAIPSQYKDTTGTDALAANILIGKKAVTTAGLVTGTMANLGDVSATITGLGAVSGDTQVVISAGYTSGGTISITSDIENQLEAI